MADIYFTRVEANRKVGLNVRSLSALGSVPQGSRGTVVKVIQSHAGQWSVRVQWKLPRTISLIDAAEVSFFRREKAPVSDVCKSAYENSIQEID